MEQQILDFIENSDTWKQFKEKYQILQHYHSYFCLFTDDTKHIQINNVNIIRFKINDEYEAKLNISNDISDIYLHYYKDIYTNRYVIKTPCHVRLPYTGSKICDVLDNDFNITKVYKNYYIDINEYRKFSGFVHTIIGSISITDIDKLDKFIKKMIEIFNKIITTISND